MKTLYLEKWDNYPLNDPKRLEALEQVITAVEQEIAVKIVFDYEGKTRHVSASHAMIRMLNDRGKEYIYNIDYDRYYFVISREVENV